jgi:hypothetical protein
VATYSTGITVTWNSVTFTEVFGLSWGYGGAREDRGSGTAAGWTSDPGQITFSCFGATGVTTSNFGKRGSVAITGGGATYNGYAIFESLDVATELNGVTRYTVTLKQHN